MRDLATSRVGQHECLLWIELDDRVEQLVRSEMMASWVPLGESAKDCLASDMPGLMVEKRRFPSLAR